MGWKMPIVIKVATAIINPEKYTLIVIGFEFFFCRGAVFFLCHCAPSDGLCVLSSQVLYVLIVSARRALYIGVLYMELPVWSRFARNITNLFKSNKSFLQHIHFVLLVRSRFARNITDLFKSNKSFLQHFHFINDAGLWGTVL